MTGDRTLKHIVFDLDDTLLDTYRQLIPQATREACQAMIASGLKAEVESCVLSRSRFSRIQSRQSFFDYLTSEFGVLDGVDAGSVVRAGYTAFHDREVESDIALFPGARDLIKDLRGRYGVHLVTAGHRPTQESKIRILDLDAAFDSISHIDPSRGEKKKTAFSRIMERSGARPDQHLSVGNRLDTDIADAKELGWRTCWVRYGEYAEWTPASELEMADWEIPQIKELIRECRL